LINIQIMTAGWCVVCILVVLILCFILCFIVSLCTSIYILTKPINSIILKESVTHELISPETSLGEVLDIYEQYYKIASELASKEASKKA